MNATFVNVIVKMFHDETIGSIHIPENARSTSGEFYGEVVSVGPDVAHALIPGDKVLFERHEGKEIEVDGEKLIVLHQNYIMARIEEE